MLGDYETTQEFTGPVSKDFKKRLLGILASVIDRGEPLRDADASIYFHWARHKNDDVYNFVPRRYRK